MEEDTSTATTTIKAKTPWKLIIFIFTIFILTVGGFVYILLNVLRDGAEQDKRFVNELRKSSTCSYQKDSLIRKINYLSSYKSLTESMLFRDEAISTLKYKVGDYAHMKNDSSLIVIADIIIGGSKYEYYVHYKVLYKDKTEEEVKPELIY